MYLPDDTALVDTPVELHHDLASPVVIDVFELVDVTCARESVVERRVVWRQRRFSVSRKTLPCDQVAETHTRKRKAAGGILFRLSRAEVKGGRKGGKRTVLLHDLEELDHHLRHGAHQHLALAALLGVVHRLRRGRGERREGRGSEKNQMMAFIWGKP